MTFDYKPLLARIVAAAIAWGATKLAAHGVTVDVSVETQAAIVVAIYGSLHSLSKQVFGKKAE